jgi:hypothetical protein
VLRKPSFCRKYCRSFAAGILASISEHIIASFSTHFSATIVGHISTTMIFDSELPRAMQHIFTQRWTTVCRDFAATLS